MLARLLTHPLTRGLDLDEPATTALRRRLVAEKPFLREDLRGVVSRARGRRAAG